MFQPEQMSGGEGDAFFKLGDHQFLAIFEVDKVQRANMRHFGIMVRDEAQLEEVKKKLTEKYKLKLEPPFRCDFRDPWGNRIQVVDLHDESLVWLLPYREAKTGLNSNIGFSRRQREPVSTRSSTPLGAKPLRLRRASLEAPSTRRVTKKTEWNLRRAMAISHGGWMTRSLSLPLTTEKFACRDLFRIHTQL
jgi:hypothetical protein